MDHRTGNPPIPSMAETKIFTPSSRRRFWLQSIAGACAFSIAGPICLAISNLRWLGVLVSFGPMLGLAGGYFFLCASMRLEVGSEGVVRDWILGRRIFPLAGSGSLSFTETRSSNLILKLDSRKMMIFRYAFSGAQMRAIRAAIEEEAARAGIALGPDKLSLQIMLGVGAGFVMAALAFGYFCFWAVERMLAAQH